MSDSTAAWPGPAPVMAAGHGRLPAARVRPGRAAARAVVGIGLAADTFDVANTLPNQFYLLLAGGVLNAVLVPQITKAATHADGGRRVRQPAADPLLRPASRGPPC